MPDTYQGALLATIAEFKRRGPILSREHLLQLLIDVSEKRASVEGAVLSLEAWTDDRVRRENVERDRRAREARNSTPAVDV